MPRCVKNYCLAVEGNAEDIMNVTNSSACGITENSWNMACMTKWSGKITEHQFDTGLDANFIQQCGKQYMLART